jgi:asparagine synthase (glutamine-hydrolysing)
MRTADGRFVIAYNGELYNYLELRVELQALGARFQSNSDTEVVLEALSRWGKAALLRFNGIFALALWDERERRLTLARDRFGIKPLYYARTRDSVVFGSEVKALLAHPSVQAKLDLAGLREYMTFQNFYGERTLFAGVSTLPAATWMDIDASGRVTSEAYWRIRFDEVEDDRSEDDVSEELRYLFRQAVTRQLVADVEVGSYLSGGMDSGSVAAVAAANLPHLRTFTCGFDISSASGLELYFDERRDAERMSAIMRSEHYEMVLKAGDMERIMPRLVRHIEEPRVGQSYPNFFIAGLTSKFVRV